MRRRAKKDANHNQIAKELEDCKCTVLDLSAVGGGAPDMAVGYGQENYFLEIVGPDKLKRFPPCGRSQNQREWHETWRGTVFTVKSTQEALQAMGIWPIEKGFRDDS